MPKPPPWRRPILLLCVLVLLLLLSAALSQTSRYQRIDLSTADAYVQRRIDEKNVRLGRTLTAQSTPYPDFYQALADEASLTGEKRDALLRLRESKYHGMDGTFCREAYMLADRLPADQPRLTLEQARALLANPPTDLPLVQAFVEAAGPPDFMVTNLLLPYWIFFLDEDGDEVIRTDSVNATYIRYDAQGNEQSTIDLDGLPVPATSAPVSKDNR